ncbi:glycosyltransferase family 4 protein [Aequorivita sinensis]|uniref:glycosyltransferase family 4 protein n=1 Tax=Aequorivita sinensis TaxID=1382458 RepID=UPI0023005D8C|nr:glycosyltransferase family 4 protein [Aequorivita sinensis]
MKVIQLFDQYSEFYQPYIPPVMDALREQSDIVVEVVAFRGELKKSSNVQILPKYNKRRIFSRIFQLFNNSYKGLDYFEIKTLKDKVDIIHVQHSYLFTKVIRLLQIPKENRPKIIITLRGGDTYIKPWIGEKWRNFYRDYGNKVDAFVVMSEDQKQYLSRWGVSLDNIQVIPISFGKQFQSIPKVQNENKIKLVSVFRMCWEKNIDDNLRFVKVLKQRNIPVSYDVYGDGPDFGQVFYLRNKYGLIDEVNILGKINNEDLKKKIKVYDFILQLSFSESLGMSVIEAQSMGVPAIVSENGGLPEIIQDGINGVIVDLESLMDGVDKVFSIWESQSDYFTMSKNAIERVQQKYSVENEVARLTNLYKQLG